MNADLGVSPLDPDLAVVVVGIALGSMGVALGCHCCCPEVYWSGRPLRQKPFLCIQKWLYGRTSTSGASPQRQVQRHPTGNPFIGNASRRQVFWLLAMTLGLAKLLGEDWDPRNDLAVV